MLANADGAFIANGDAIKIYPHQTLNTVFGPPDRRLGWFEHVSQCGQSGRLESSISSSTIYWYKSTSATPGWRGPAGLLVDAGNTPLYIDQDIEVLSKYAKTTNSVVVVGAVKLGNTQTVVPANGLAFVGDMYATSVTLSNLHLYTGNANTGVIGSNTSANADNVAIWDPVAQSSVLYWYKSTSATPGWRGPQRPAN